MLPNYSKTPPEIHHTHTVSVVAKVVFAVCQYIKCSCRLEKLQQLTNFIVSCWLLVRVFWRLNIL